MAGPRRKNVVESSPDESDDRGDAAADPMEVDGSDGGQAAAAKSGAAPTAAAESGSDGDGDGDDDDGDPVVLELPVYVCNEFMGSSTQLSLLQHPLRPPWRPYDYKSASAFRMKPVARRVEVELPLETQGRNYNDIIEDFKKIQSFKLRSQLVDAKASVAIGTVQGGKLLLVPVDYGLQLRPTLQHLDVGNEKKRKEDADEEDEDDEPVMRAVEVQVQKRETERQQQARLNSYAHLSAKEEEEAWVPLRLHPADTQPAHTIWDRFVQPRDAALAVDMSRTAYLKSFVPSLGGQHNAGDGGSVGAVGSQLGDAAGGADGRSSPTPVVKLPADAAAALTASMRAFFNAHGGVASLANVRAWLAMPEGASHGASLRDMQNLTDRSLHEAVMETGLVESVRRVYLCKAMGHAGSDPFRAIVIEVLKEKETFRRAEMTDAAQLRKVNVSDTMYNRVVKDMCVSRGHNWMLKSGSESMP